MVTVAIPHQLKCQCLLTQMVLFLRPDGPSPFAAVAPTKLMHAAAALQTIEPIQILV